MWLIDTVICACLIRSYRSFMTDGICCNVLFSFPKADVRVTSCSNNIHMHINNKFKDGGVINYTP